MLSKSEYENLWVTHFEGLTSIEMPDYGEYVVREHMIEDYLDIFRGRSTRLTRSFVPYDHPYAHPFFDELGKPLYKEKIPPFIKYIFISEAPSLSNTPESPLFIYNIQRLGGACITSPLGAFGYDYTGMTQVERLLALASEGILIIELFPFAIDYSKLRHALLSGVVNGFFDSLDNTYSVKNRLSDIEELISIEFKKIIPNACFIACPTVSYYLSAYINLPQPNSFLNFRLGVNTFTHHNPLSSPSSSGLNIPVTTHPNHLIGIIPFQYPLENINTVPTFCCSTYSGIRGLPNSLFIKNALGLEL